MDIHEECKSKKTSDKVEAISKLTFLYLLGYDIKSYAFNTIECMSSTDPIIKRAGYLASVFSFGSPDMQTLSTNLYINDIKSKYQQVKCMALSSLASCPAPNREQVQTVLPILYEQLTTAGNTMTNTPLVIRLIATTLRLLVLGKRQDVENIQDFVPDFVEILFNLASVGNLTKDVVITQVYCHTALELGRNFGQDQVMKLIPSLYDILLTAKQPWILIEVSRFFGLMAVYDSRVKSKVREQFMMLLTATESKSLLMELAKAIAEGYKDDEEMVRTCTKRMADFIIPGVVRSDSNLKILALKNLAVLERAIPGAIMRIDGLPNELINVLDDKDFNLRIVALDVIGSMANPQFIENIVNKLLVCLKEARQMSKGKSLKELHQVSASDVMVFKRKVVEVVLDMCSRDNYANVNNFNWFVDVLITLSMEYPQISADECAQKLLDLALKSDDLKAVAPKLVSIILENQQFMNIAGVSAFDNVQVPSLSLGGPVVDQPFPNIQGEIEVYNKILCSKYGSCQVHTKEIVESIAMKLMQLPKNGPVTRDFAGQFYKIMEDNGATNRKFTQDRVIISTPSRTIQNDDLNLFRSVSNLLSVSAWIMGTFLCYQPAGDDAVNLYDCLQILLNNQIKSLSADTAQVYVMSAFKAFIGLLFSYHANKMFEDEEVSKQCVTEGYFGEKFLLMKELSDDEIAAIRKNLIQERDKKNAELDQTFMTDEEKAKLQEIPEVDEVVPQFCDSLIKMFIISYDYLVQRIKELSLQSGMHDLCDQLFYILKNQSTLLKELGEKVQDEETKKQLLEIMAKYSPSAVVEGQLEPTLENIGNILLQINPEEQLIQQRQVPRPEFQFDNQQLFSLDIPEGFITSSYDMEEFKFEETVNQEMQEQKKKRHHHDELQQEPPASIFSEFVGQQVQEQQVQEQPESGLKGEAAVIFGGAQQGGEQNAQPQVKSIFYLDKSKFSRADKNSVQLGKYTSGLKIGTVSKPVI